MQGEIYVESSVILIKYSLEELIALEGYSYDKADLMDKMQVGDTLDCMCNVISTTGIYDNEDMIVRLYFHLLRTFYVHAVIDHYLQIPKENIKLVSSKQKVQAWNIISEALRQVYLLPEDKIKDIKNIIIQYNL